MSSDTTTRNSDLDYLETDVLYVYGIREEAALKITAIIAELRLARAVLEHLSAAGGYMADGGKIRCRMCDGLMDNGGGHWNGCSLAAYTEWKQQQIPTLRG